MLTIALRGPIAAASLTCSLAAAAQSPRPDPLDAQAAVPPLVYRSALAAARPASAPAMLNWRAANDEAARIGGWRAYAREASAPAKP